MMATQGNPGGQGNDDDDSRKRDRDSPRDKKPTQNKRRKRSSKPPDVLTALAVAHGQELWTRIEQIITLMKQTYTVYKYLLTDPNKKEDKGKQSAKTYGPNQCGFKTGQGGFPNMHSEMVCVNSQLTSQTWQVAPSGGNQSGQIVGATNVAIPSGDFKTDEPHCGVCSIFLFLLNLPLGKPCVGKPLLGPDSYPLPDQIAKSVPFLIKLLGSLKFLKQIIGTMHGLEWDEFQLVCDVNDPPVEDGEVIVWTTFCGQANNLKNLWLFIKRVIFNVTVAEYNKPEYKTPFDKY